MASLRSVAFHLFKKSFSEAKFSLMISFVWSFKLVVMGLPLRL
jgi:hypothetical protein